MGRELTAQPAPVRVTPGRPAVLRLTVLADGTRRDLAVPTGVSVAELVPELAPELPRPGGHSVRVARGPVVLVRGDGTPLEPDRSLDEQDVREGDVLALVPPSSLGPRDVVDDPVDAVRSVLRDQGPTDDAARAARRTSWLALTATSLVAAGGVLVDRTALLLGAAGAVGALLAVAGLVAGRRTGTGGSAVACVVGAGVVGAAVIVPGTGPASTAILAPPAGTALHAGLVVLVVAGILALAVPRRPERALAVAVPGLLLLLAGSALALAPVLPSQVAAVLGAMAVLLVRAVPWMVVSTAGLGRSAVVVPAGRRAPAAPGGVDLTAVAADVDRTRRWTRALVAGLGSAGAVAVPVLVATSGPWSAALGGCLSLLVLLVGRRAVEPGLRRAARLTGGAALLTGAVTGLVVPGPARPVLAVGAAVVAVGLGLRDLAPPRASLPDRVLAVLDVALLVTVPPLLAVTLGLLPWVPGASS